MPTIDQIYRENLRLLVDEVGTQDALAEKIHKSPAQISQWLNASKDSKTGKPRAMSRNTARDVERLCGKPEGWMDRSHAAAGSNTPKGGVFHELTEEEWDFLQNFREIPDEDRRRHAREIAERAAISRAFIAEHMRKAGLPTSTTAHEAAKQLARSAVEAVQRNLDFEGKARRR